jgi:hypothetical protein
MISSTQLTSVTILMITELFLEQLLICDEFILRKNVFLEKLNPDDLTKHILGSSCNFVVNFFTNFIQSTELSFRTSITVNKFA